MDKLVGTPLFPLYSDVRSCLRAWDGESVKAVREMIKTIHSLTGTPQDPVDWSEPDKWIPVRLSGEDRRLAQKVWSISGSKTNPRHVYGSYLFINSMNLLSQVGGTYKSNERTTAFLQNEPAVVAELDALEGIPRLLSLVGQKGSAKRSDLLDDWANYLLQVSKFSKPSTWKDSLRRRLLNLAERGFINRDGNYYSLSPAGLSYLEFVGAALPVEAGAAKGIDVSTSINAHNEEARQALHERLMGLDPYAFEHFVKELLEAMDYEDVQVTKQSGDKGVDVVANFQFGITEIKEVVQVKRSEQTVRRPTIDQLRGALPYHGAIRGTIITLGKFAKGVDAAALHPGAAPITLIDGQRLLELAEKYAVGLRKKPAYLMEVDEAFFAEKADAPSDDDLDALIG